MTPTPKTRPTYGVGRFPNSHVVEPPVTTDVSIATSFWRCLMRSRQLGGRHAAATLLIAIVAAASCVDAGNPTAPRAAVMDHARMTENVDNPNSAAGDAQGFISGWLDGDLVALRYTRLYFCSEPPESAVASNCEVGAPSVVTPRSGPIPKIYALAPAGFQPDPATLHCKGGILCLNHPPMLDLSRLGLPSSVSAPAHSHILPDRQAGWHNTVNIRVPSLAVWNEIAAAKSLTKIRELQAAGRLGPDIPTNVYFFLEVQQERPE